MLKRYYNETKSKCLENIQNVLYGCQRGVHNAEMWGDFGEYEKMESVFREADEYIKKLEDENKELKKRLSEINLYCIKHKEITWAAMIYGIINDCDFQDITKEGEE